MFQYKPYGGRKWKPCTMSKVAGFAPIDPRLPCPELRRLSSPPTNGGAPSRELPNYNPDSTRLFTFFCGIIIGPIFPPFCNCRADWTSQTYLRPATSLLHYSETETLFLKLLRLAMVEIVKLSGRLLATA